MIDFPVTLHLLGKSILLHPVLESLGIFLGMRYYFYLKRKSSEKLLLHISLAVIAGATAGALIGSKLLGNLENPYTLFSDAFSLKKFWSNNTIVGGLALGLVGVELAKKIVGHKDSTGDLITFPLILAIIIGRIGCFFTGIYEETYGLPTDSVFGMHLGDEYLRHPVSLYEIIFLILLWVILKMIQKRNFPSGFVFQVFMFSYFTFRFFLDFLKPRVELVGNLGAIQLTCLLVIIYYIYKINVTLRYNFAIK
ncbi:prolipoprotein diacylglyceryl transferase [Elizabethkingia meningoseptica]|uniref:prolipoprotein diacylglyceryl transferase n=1 Tax=Elizabethkingia meningoseptica TaxID=238 RepID=UPI0022F16F36|nr:prolipoprotein diacylglyceryl transferase family protein [Elizabethkingia meningoseptica]EJK5328720.1 prolipoprotein diacylglyceryl transferase [Elizabethkingia meningoseptica]MDE5468499.1 prolipoprotein diacylglyceryl transferase [Elizabethkingia meningoseptica]MDE5475448.1 prolipoprotein diacylglyceryl transferase [Elizabethkingia meningoseptica]MDE5479324.1 prolipoprotein diacylglyceryl transferase [Elizabethkingia meningoseptica]MDE5485699.1 prolipoprotein diacylglyceryl transferase [El